MRYKSIFDEPFAGVLKDAFLQYELGIVRRINTKDRSINVVWTNREGGRSDVPILHNSENFSMPIEGDVAVIIFDKNERPLCIGFIDPTYGIQIDEGTSEEAKDGEVLLTGRILGPDDDRVTQQLRFLKNGDIVLENALGDGITLRNRDKLLTSKAQTIYQETAAGTFVNGMVMRKIDNYLGILPSTDPVPLLSEAFFSEQGFKSTDPLTQLDRARFLMGDIIDDNSIPEESMLGQPLLIVLQTILESIPLAGLSIDVQGNVFLQTTTGQIIVMGNNISVQSVVDINLKAPTINVLADTIAQIKSPVNVLVSAPIVELGSLGTKRALVTEDVLAALINHIHEAPPLGGPTSTSPELVGIASAKTTETRAS